MYIFIVFLMSMQYTVLAWLAQSYMYESILHVVRENKSNVIIGIVRIRPTSSELNLNVVLLFHVQVYPSKISKLRRVAHCIPDKVKIKEQLKRHNFRMFTN